MLTGQNERNYTMADYYTWNEKQSSQRYAIEQFLALAQDYIELHPDKLPFKAVYGNLTINWLRGLLDRKPSTLGEAAKRLIDRQA
jgi:hypothetical protein